MLGAGFTRTQACGLTPTTEVADSPDGAVLHVPEADRQNAEWLNSAATMLYLLGDVVDAARRLRKVTNRASSPAVGRLDDDAHARQGEGKGTECDGDGGNENGRAGWDDVAGVPARQQIGRLQELQTAMQRLADACTAAGVPPPPLLAEARKRATLGAGTDKERNIQRLVEMGYDPVRPAPASETQLPCTPFALPHLTAL